MELTRRFEEHCRIQNTHLSTIDNRLEAMATQNASNAQERTKQIGEVKTLLAEKMGDLFRTAVALVVPILVGLGYIILQHVLAGTVP